MPSQFRKRGNRLRTLFLINFSLFSLFAQTLTSPWVQLGPNGQVLARVVVDSAEACPSLKADGKALAMKPRTPVPDGFKPACEAEIPASTRSLRLCHVRLRLPKTPRKVIALGDTGCRVKGNQIQNCDDPKQWPFRVVAGRIRRESPALIVHVGDYLYRESPCPDPAKGCAGPHGDNWLAWKADFFDPAAEALPVAPWAFSRGNHEDCERAWRGWFYYLDPRPFTATCDPYSAAYIAQSGALHIGMLDSAAVHEDSAEQVQVGHYQEALRSFTGRVSWLADHHPFWAYKSVPNAPDTMVSRPLAEAWNLVKPEGIRLVLSGHIHLFEFLNYNDGRPSQLVAGDGGTALTKNVTVPAAESKREFGYTVLTRRRSDWRLTLKNAQGKILATFSTPDNR